MEGTRSEETMIIGLKILSWLILTVLVAIGTVSGRIHQGLLRSRPIAPPW